MIKVILERLGKLSSRERAILAFASAAGLILFVQRLIVMPVYMHLEETREQIELRQRQIIKNEKNVEMKDKIVPLYEEIVTKVKIEGSEDQKIAAMLHELEKLGSETEVVLSNVKPRPAKTVDLYRVFSADLDAECTMAKLFGLLHKLQQSGQLFRVEGLKIRNHEKDPALVRVSMNVTRLVLEEASSGK